MALITAISGKVISVFRLKTLGQVIRLKNCSSISAIFKRPISYILIYGCVSILFLSNANIFRNSISCKAVASVRQGGGPMPPLNFGPEVQYFNEFLKKDYMLFVFNVIQNEKVFLFFCKIK